MHWIILLALAIIVSIITYFITARGHGSDPDAPFGNSKKSIDQLTEYPYAKKCSSPRLNMYFTIF